MTGAAPSEGGATLYTFPISHFCEKARWALDWHALPFDEVAWPPLVHFWLAKRLGARGTSVPILKAGASLIEGSAAIIDWAEANGTGHSLDSPAAREAEAHADRVIGPLVRRHFYSEMLPDHASEIAPAFFADARGLTAIAGRLVWPISTRMIPRAYKADPARRDEFRARVEAELDALDDRLADGRRFLADDHFSRADIAVASLLGPLARPPEQPLYTSLKLSDRLEATLADWSERPSIRWVRTLYRSHRAGPPAAL